MIPSEYPFNSFSFSKRPSLLESKALHCAAFISLSVIPVIVQRSAANLTCQHKPSSELTLCPETGLGT